MNVRSQKRLLYLASASLMIAGLAWLGWVLAVPVELEGENKNLPRQTESKKSFVAPPPSESDLVRIGRRRLQQPLIELTSEPETDQTPQQPAAPSLPSVELIALLGSGNSARAVVIVNRQPRQTVAIGDAIGAWEIVSFDRAQVNVRSGSFEKTIPWSGN